MSKKEEDLIRLIKHEAQNSFVTQGPIMYESRVLVKIITPKGKGDISKNFLKSTTTHLRCAEKIDFFTKSFCFHL